MGFFLLLFLYVQGRRRLGRWVISFWGAPLTVTRWDHIPGGRLGAPLHTSAGMTPYSLIRWEAEATRIHNLATSVGLLALTSNLNGHSREGG